MVTKTIRLASMAASVAAAGLLASTLAASAQDATYDMNGARMTRTHTMRATHEAYRPLTVGPRTAYAPPPPPAYNPYAGPGAIVTGPVSLASSAVALPFRAVNAVFPPQGSPLSIIGAPVYFAGQVAQLPFRMIQAPFGGPNPFTAPATY